MIDYDWLYITYIGMCVYYNLNVYRLFMHTYHRFMLILYSVFLCAYASNCVFLMSPTPGPCPSPRYTGSLGCGLRLETWLEWPVEKPCHLFSCRITTVPLVTNLMNLVLSSMKTMGSMRCQAFKQCWSFHVLYTNGGQLRCSVQANSRRHAF